MLYFSPWKTAIIAVICLLGLIFAAPNLVSHSAVHGLPAWLPRRQVSLGLDLSGGSYLMYEVEMAPVVRDWLNNVADDLRTKFRQMRFEYTGGLQVSGTDLTFTLRDRSRASEVISALRQIDPGLVANVDGAGRVAVALSQAALDQRSAEALQQTIAIVRRRIDATGVREPSVQTQGSNRIIVQLPGIGTPERIKQIIGKTARLTFQLVDAAAPATSDTIPPGDELLPLEEGGRPGGSVVEYAVKRRVIMSGDMLVDAQATFQENQPVVSFKLDSMGTQRFAEATRDNVGRQFAIVLDGKIISAPVIREPIPGGSGVISGGFTVLSANDLALLLRAGALPAPLTIIEERTVGPSLGADSIRAGKLACTIAVVLVVGFMVAFYGLFGLFADIALFLNLCLMIAALSLLGATLTLPGIAGIALTLGMAVDANVLIYERIREEVRAGRMVMSALEMGFRRAFGTILDSHVTTLVAGALMYYFGAGPVRGFAVTLSIGVITSLFSAVLVTRLIIVTWLRRDHPRSVPI
ncbi:MAG TPA: protein translocase subunit SecD [Stellaceae bacterium]|nr:protein translocase subunit SecD [Stellaceae bacterium]